MGASFSGRGPRTPAAQPWPHPAACRGAGDRQSGVGRCSPICPWTQKPHDSSPWPCWQGQGRGLRSNGKTVSKLSPPKAYFSGATAPEIKFRDDHLGASSKKKPGLPVSSGRHQAGSPPGSTVRPLRLPVLTLGYEWAAARRTSNAEAAESSSFAPAGLGKERTFREAERKATRGRAWRGAIRGAPGLRSEVPGGRELRKGRGVQPWSPGQKEKTPEASGGGGGSHIKDVVIEREM